MPVPTWDAWQNTQARTGGADTRTGGASTASAPSPQPSGAPKWVQPTNHVLPDLSWPAPPPGLPWPDSFAQSVHHPPGLPPGLSHPGRISPQHQLSRSAEPPSSYLPPKPKSLPDRPRTPPGRLERVGRLSIDSATGLNALSPEFRPSPRDKTIALPPVLPTPTIDAARAFEASVGTKLPSARTEAATGPGTPSTTKTASHGRGSDEALEIDGFLDELDGADPPVASTTPVKPVEPVAEPRERGAVDAGTQTDPAPVLSFDYSGLDLPKPAKADAPKPLVARLDALYKPAAEVASYTILPQTRPIVKISEMSVHTSSEHLEAVLPRECLPSKTDSGVSLLFACEPKTGMPRKFAFIEVNDEAAVDDVISTLNNLEVLGEYIKARRASPGELLEALFPISSRWFAYGQRIASTSKDPAEMTPEILLAARICTSPPSRFHMQLRSRPYTAFASLIARYPWHQPALWNRSMANALYTICLSVLKWLMRQLHSFPFPGACSALVSVVIAMTRCPAFTSPQIRHLRSMWERARPVLAHTDEHMSPPCYAGPTAFVVKSAVGEAVVPVVPSAPVVKLGPPTVWPPEIVCQLAELHLDIGSFESARASSQWLLNAMGVARHWRDALLPMLCSFAAIGPVRTSLLAFYESPLLAHDDLGMDMLGHLRIQLVGGEASQQVVRGILAYAPRLTLLALDSEGDIDRTLFDAIPDDLLVLELRGAALSVRAVTLVNRLLRLERLGLGGGAAPTTVRLLTSICGRRGIVLSHL